MSDLQKPAYPAPEGPPDVWGVQQLHEHLQTALLLELHTIPLYLYPAYSIKSDSNSRRKIIGIVIQEMLHLALAGNLLCATRGEPKIYGKIYTPVYPCEIFYENEVELHLAPASQDAIQSFVELEAPYKPPTLPRTNILPGYRSIGQFYEAVKSALQILAKANPDLFDPDSLSRQFSEDDNIYFGDGLTKIQDLTSAIAALTLIVEQGEGSTGDPSLNITSHYQIFKELEGKSIDHYPLVQDPKTSDYKDKPIQKPMLAFDAAYSYLLLSIERCWVKSSHREDLVSNISNMMSGVLKPIAEFLVLQDLGNGDHAAPAFNHFEYDMNKSVRSQLVAAISAAIEAFPNVDKLTRALASAEALFDVSQMNE